LPHALLSLDRKIDVENEDLNKLKVKDLKRVLSELGGECKGCTEKSEFIREIYKKHGKTEL